MVIPSQEKVLGCVCHQTRKLSPWTTVVDSSFTSKSHLLTRYHNNKGQFLTITLLLLTQLELRNDICPYQLRMLHTCATRTYIPHYFTMTLFRGLNLVLRDSLKASLTMCARRTSRTSVPSIILTRKDVTASCKLPLQRNTDNAFNKEYHNNYYNYSAYIWMQDAAVVRGCSGRAWLDSSRLLRTACCIKASFTDDKSSCNNDSMS